MQLLVVRSCGHSEKVAYASEKFAEADAKRAGLAKCVGCNNNDQVIKNKQLMAPMR